MFCNNCVQGCGFNYHKRCASKIPNNCSGSRQRNPSAIPLSPKSSIGTTLSSVQTTSTPVHHVKPSPSISQLNTPDIFVTSEEDGNATSPVIFLFSVEKL